MSASIGRPLAIALVALAAAAAALPARAGSDIFVCQDADGRKTYQNTGAGRGCTRLDIQPTLSVPAPRQPAGRGPAEARPISPASFPRVDGQTQKARDGDRRRILEDELGSEEAKLQALKTEYRNGAPERLPGDRGDAGYRERAARMQAELQRTENNVASLKRELALLSRQ
jgi:hypothetical protein